MRRLLLSSTLLLSICAMGCKSIPVHYGRQLLNTVCVEYLDYVNNDPKLKDRQKRVRRANVATFEKVVKELEGK